MLTFFLGKVDAELNKNIREIESSVMKAQRAGDFNNFLTLPQEAMVPDEILEELQKYKEMGKFKVEEGKVSGVVYNGGPELTKVVTAASNMYEWTNPLHPDVFPGLRKIESECISMVTPYFFFFSLKMKVTEFF